MQIDPLVSAGWLQQHLDQVVVLDGSYYLPAMGKDAEAEFIKAHIPGALRWDIDRIADQSSGLKHMMPPAQQVADAAGELGIDRDTAVVVYDQPGMFSAARVWLALKSIGHEKLALLDGGLPQWRGPLEQGSANAVSPLDYGHHTPHVNTVGRAAVLSALDDDDACVVDARSADRFKGLAAEPVPGLRGGHMPGALNVPYPLLLDEDSKFKSKDELSEVFRRQGVDLECRIITSCGSGVTAAIVTFALMLLGRQSAVYDGSWSEWGKPELDLPIESESV